MLVRTLNLVDGNAVIRIGSSLTYVTIVFNNKTFAMFEVTAGQAYGLTHQRDPISCGENITIYREYSH